MGEKRPIVITGGDGALASYTKGCLLLSKREVDVEMSDAIEKITRLNPRAIIHLAAMTDHKACEADPVAAYMVNAIGSYHVALAARVAGAKLCYVSSNAVFDGEGSEPFSVTDVPRPRSAYGRSKYAGECLVLGVLPTALVVRSGWIFGGGPAKDKKFVGAIMRQIRSGREELKAVHDVIGTPTYGKDLMTRILKLVEEGRGGVVHVTNAGIASRFDMAESIVTPLHMPVVAVDAASFGPGIVKNEALQGEVMRPWQDALQEYVEQEWNK